MLQWDSGTSEVFEAAIVIRPHELLELLQLAVEDCVVEGFLCGALVPRERRQVWYRVSHEIVFSVTGPSSLIGMARLARRGKRESALLGAGGSICHYRNL